MRRKQRIKQIHEPTTHEVFLCLSCYPWYCEILLAVQPDKSYSRFLQWILGKNFYADSSQKITIKKIAADFHSDSAKVTKWLRLIYEDIFDLNYEKPELFQTNGIKVLLSITYYDSHCLFYVWLPAVPRQYENIHFHFVKAKVGSDSFWVKDISYEIEQLSAVHIQLQGSILNRYREFALEKAFFQKGISRYALHDMHDFQVDDWLKKLYPQ